MWLVATVLDGTDVEYLSSQKVLEDSTALAAKQVFRPLEFQGWVLNTWLYGTGLWSFGWLTFLIKVILRTSLVVGKPAYAGDTDSIPTADRPTCRGATKPMHHNCWACALKQGKPSATKSKHKSIKNKVKSSWDDTYYSYSTGPPTKSVTFSDTQRHAHQ